MKKLIVDKYSPIKHVCRINPMGDLIPVSSFQRDYEINESDWGDDYILVYAYKVWDSADATKSEILDYTEYGKHLKIYSDLAELDGTLDVFPLDTSTGYVPVTTRVEAQTMMNLLTSYTLCYSEEAPEVTPIIRDLARLLYNETDFGYSVQLPEHFREFIGVE